MSTCIFCGAAIEPKESGLPAGKSGYLYCRNCLRHRDALARGLRAGDEGLQGAIEGVLAESKTKDRTVKDAINGIIYQLDPLFEEEELERFEAELGREERAQQELEQKRRRFIMATTGTLEGRAIGQYCGVCTSMATAAAFEAVSRAKGRALDRLREACIEAGADACVDVRISLMEHSAGKVLVNAMGTAVKLA